jgi:hypothetical protein
MPTNHVAAPVNGRSSSGALPGGSILRTVPAAVVEAAARQLRRMFATAETF